MDAEHPFAATLCYACPAAKQFHLPVNGIHVPEQLPDTARKIGMLKAPAVRAILDLLGLPSDQIKKVNAATLSRYLKVHGTLEPPHRHNAALVYQNPFLCGNQHPHAEAHGPSVVCADDVKASVHFGLDLAALPKNLMY